MKKYYYCFIIATALIYQNTSAQTILLGFSASGVATTIDSVFVQNLTDCNTITLYPPDTLALNIGVGTNVLNANQPNISFCREIILQYFCV